MFSLFIVITCSFTMFSVVVCTFWRFCSAEIGADGRATEIVPFEFSRNRWGSMRRHNFAADGVGGGKNGSNLCSQNMNSWHVDAFRCHVSQHDRYLFWHLLNYRHWIEHPNWSSCYGHCRAASKKMLVRSYWPSEISLTSSPGSQENLG